MRGTHAWPPTGLIPWFSKTEGNTYATLLHHPFLFKEIQRSAQEVARRISGAVAGESTHKSRHTKYPSQTLIPRITLFDTDGTGDESTLAKRRPNDSEFLDLDA